MASPARPLRERVTFRLDTPTQVNIESPGVQQDGRDGPEWRYFLEGDQIMWVPDEPHRQISGTAAAFPLAVEITKTRNGWNVVRLEDEPPEATPPPKQPATRPAARTRPATKPAAAAAPEPQPHTPQQARIPEPDPEPTTMYAALCAAIRTAAAAEKFAQEIGRPVAFDTADIRAIAATLYIHATGGSR